MATLKDLDLWIRRDLTRFTSFENGVLATRDDCEEPGERGIVYLLYTRTNRYRIRAVERMNEVPSGGYLGCTSSCRTPRAGENWTRGRDLADGPLTEETWHRILGDIVSYEMVKVHSHADLEPIHAPPSDSCVPGRPFMFDRDDPASAA